MFTAVFYKVDELDNEHIAVDVEELKHCHSIYSGVSMVQNLFPIGRKLGKIKV